MNWETLKLEEREGATHLVLNRPLVHNAVNTRMLMDLNAACEHLSALPDCRVVVLRGEGASFCSGADLKEGLTHKGGTPDTIRRARLGRRAVQALSDLPAITIAAVHGSAIGGGACLAAACDFRIGAENARVSLRESSLGLSLSWNSIPNFVHLVGPSRAKEMILFGEMYRAETLESYGFFNEVAPAAELAEAVQRWTEKVLRQPPLPVQMTKASINALVKALDRPIFHLDDYGLALTGKSGDAAKAREAFFSGDTPPWEGQ